MVRKYLAGFVLAGVSLALMAGCSNPSKPFNSGSEVLKVSASFFPVAHLVRQVAGDRAEVSVVIPEGMEPHDYEPNAKALAQVFESHLFVYNGAGLEPWADRIRSELEAKGIRVIKMSEHVELLSGISGGATKEDGVADPHIWIDPVHARRQAELVRDALVELDPFNAEGYKADSVTLIDRLKSLDADFRSGLSSCKDHTVILSHAAFQYLANRYGFRILSVSGLSPHEEPTPKHFMALADEAKKLGIRYIFFDRQDNPKLAEILASEIGGETLDLYHIDGGFTPEESLDPNLYPDQMRKNLTQLRKAMNCL